MTTRALFNTLDFAKDLEGAGMEQKQAEAIADNLNKVLESTLTPVITKREADKGSLDDLTKEVTLGFAVNNENMAKLETRLVKWMCGLVIGQLITILGFVFAVIKYTH